MPVEIPYIKPGSVSESVQVPDVPKSSEMTVGKIAAGVFLGNLAIGILVAVFWALFVH